MGSFDRRQDPAEGIHEKRQDFVHHSAIRGAFPAAGVSGHVEGPVLDGDVPQAGVPNGLDLVT